MELRPKQRTSDRPRPVIALAGNPNVGKSTLFNALTGSRQHTGNWPGKTVDLAQGRFTYKAREYRLMDLPGTYSLLGNSREEQVAAELICTGDADCVVAVCDATCLERSLFLVLQVMELTDRLVVCINLLDEAEKQHLRLDVRALERELGVPVAAMSAGRRQGIEGLQERVRNVIEGFERPRPKACGLGPPDRWTRGEASHAIRRAEEIAGGVLEGRQTPDRGRWLDRLLTGPVTGYAAMALLLVAVFWLTIQGANVPSRLLEAAFGALHRALWQLAAEINAPWWLAAPLLDGVLATTGQVVAVMLPPVAIFFPLFSLLEEVGYLPRLAFLTDGAFARCGGCGKQALTTCMGFGCNAAGVMGCRIIDSPRERLVAILTNGFVPCNGRFPALIALSSLICGGAGEGLLGAVLLTGWVLLGVAGSMGASAVLSRTILRGQPSGFVLELPPYRLPRVGRVVWQAMTQKVGQVLGRAAAVAAPAGLLLWLLANVRVGGATLLAWGAGLLDPLGQFLGMSGVILLAFVLALPANELVLPVALMAASGAASLTAGTAELSVSQALLAAGWTPRIALCAGVFFLFHWPCSTTLLTIRKETGSVKWMLLAAALPTAVGVVMCGLLNWLLPVG